ncbi:hypothetical protein DI392_17935 [Vibrio albus]|uniref:Uncharacterized protein n=1 Tax=Vibrio albus TaxID=2200953 RepID=A0A2U3B567_9VIBR|nr:hypothetical protein [Vibrio albus]PWI31912.1 hypothetical protein DI392_17935 [Vibrio albus]
MEILIVINNQKTGWQILESTYSVSSGFPYSDKQGLTLRFDMLPDPSYFTVEIRPWHPERPLLLTSLMEPFKDTCALFEIIQCGKVVGKGTLYINTDGTFAGGSGQWSAQPQKGIAHFKLLK